MHGSVRNRHRSRLQPNPAGTSLVRFAPLSYADLPPGQIRLTKEERNRKRRERYPLEILGMLVLSLLILIAAFRFWPVPSNEIDESMVFDVRGQELVQIEEKQAHPATLGDRRVHQ